MANAIVFASAQTNPGGTGPTITVTLPTHAVGDIVYISIGNTGNVLWTGNPTGWNRINQSQVGTAANGLVGTWFWRKVVSGDSLPLASPVFTLGATVTRIAISRTVRGADLEGPLTLPEYTARAYNTGTANPVRPTTITTFAPEGLVLLDYFQRAATNAPDQSGYSQDQEIVISGTLVGNATELIVASQQTALANQDASPTSGARWAAGIACFPSPDYAYYRAGTAALTAGGTSATPTLPTGTSASDNRTNKDVIIATVEVAGTPTISPNTGADWTELTGLATTTSGNGSTIRRYWAYYDGSLDRQFNRSTTGEIYVYLSTYRNCDQVNPIGAVASQQNASSTTANWPTLVRSESKSSVQAAGIADATPTYTSPASWTERNDGNGTTCADQSFDAASTISGLSFTLSTASPNAVQLVEVLSVSGVASPFERAVSVTATTAITTAATFFTIFDRAAAVSASATVVVSAIRVHVRSCSVTATATISSSGPVLLEDNFNDNSRDTAKWTFGSVVFENAAVGVAETNQQLEITPLALTGSPAIYGYKSINAYDLSRREASVRIAADIGTGTEAWLVVALDVDNYLRTWVAGGNIQTRSRVAASNSNQDHGPFSFTTHTYWRIRHDALTDEIVWEYSANGSSWTELRRLARPFAITALTAYLSGGTGASMASPALVKFDDFSLRIPAAPVRERSASVTATAGIATSAESFSVLERTAAVSATAAIASSATSFSVVEATVSVGATAAITIAGQRDVLRQSAITATTMIVVSGERIVERSASITATADIATAAESFSVVESVASVEASAAITVTGYRVLERGAAITSTASVSVVSESFSVMESAVSVVATTAIETSGESFTLLERGVDLTATAEISTASHRVIERQIDAEATATIAASRVYEALRAASVTATASVIVSGQIEGGAVTHERGVAVNVSVGVDTTATVVHVLEHTVSVTATTAISTTGQRELERAATVTATVTIVAVGDFLSGGSLYERSVSITATVTIATGRQHVLAPARQTYVIESPRRTLDASSPNRIYTVVSSKREVEAA